MQKRKPKAARLTVLFLLFSLYSFSQGLTVTGKVTNQNGESLPGVTVQVKNEKITTVTSSDGTFQLTVPNGNASLIFTSIGYTQHEVALKNQRQLNIQMIPSANALENVVVVGYGTQRKSDVTGSLTSVSAKTIEERPVTNVLQAIQGKAAGVNVSSNIKPGDVPRVEIRGNRSINASNDPLYVVDGIPIVSALGVTSFSISDLNPNDIASMEILKDASATAIYGSRGANGVILISTKKGARGRVNVNYNTTISFDRYKSLTRWINAGQYIDRWREALINGRQYNTSIPNNSDLTKAPVIWYPDPFLDRNQMGLSGDLTALQSVWMGYDWDVYGVTPKMRPTTPQEQAMGWPAQVPIYNSANIRSHDWIADVVRTGVTQNHQVSLSTGTEASRLYLSLSYNNQLGVQRDQDYKRYNINLNGDITPTKWLTVGSSIIGSLSEQNYGVTANTGNTGSKDLYSRAVDQYPWAQPYDSSGAFIKNPGGSLNLWNPLIDIDQAINNRRSSSVLANAYTEVKFTPWLRYHVNFGTQLRSFRNGAWTGPNATGHLNAKPNTAGYSKDENFSWILENLLYVDKTFAKVHTLGLTFLQSAQKSRREGVSISQSGIIIPLSYWYDLGSNTLGKPDSYGTSFTENTLSSFMGRLNYTLMNKYLLTASGRYDGSSVLAPGHKWDFFPSFALAWKMQDEKFMEGFTWINELKPRLGYGVTGNSSVQPYVTTGPLSRNGYVFGSTPAVGYLPQLVQNPQLGWEKTAQWNLGLDFAILKRRLSGSVEVYKEKTTNLLFRRDLPAVTGYVQKWVNIGATQNKGLEITLSTINIDKTKFRWSTDLNFSTNKEEIVELTNGKEDIIANNLFIGQPVSGVYYHYQNAGIWQNTPEDLKEIAKFNANGHHFYPGLIKVVDQNGDYKINASDYVILGSNRPKWIAGLTNTFRYKEFSLSSFMYARVGQLYFGGYPGLFGRGETNTWSWTNPGGRWPLLITGANVDNYTPAMQFNNGSYIVVRNISLTYDAPAKWIRRAAIKNLQLNVQVLNPFIFGGDIVKMGINPDDNTNWDSVSSSGNSIAPLGGENNNTVLPQSLVFGLRLGF
jgi:TonB-dependent starch-binding outer membrane protein SusC